MSADFALITQQVFIAAQANPVCSGYPCVFGVVVFVHEVRTQMVDLLLQVQDILLDVLTVSLSVHEQAQFVQLVPDVSNLLVDVV